MTEFQLGMTYGSGITAAMMVVLWALVGELLEYREYRRETREHREVLKDEGFIELSEAESPPRTPRHSYEQSQEGTRRLHPPDLTDSSVNLDPDRARPLHWPPPRGKGLPWSAHDDQCQDDTLWPKRQE